MYSSENLQKGLADEENCTVLFIVSCYVLDTAPCVPLICFFCANEQVYFYTSTYKGTVSIYGRAILGYPQCTILPAALAVSTDVFPGSRTVAVLPLHTA